MVEHEAGQEAAIPVADLSYTEASRELDSIVAFFEGRDVDVDQLVARLERATAIVDELDRRLRRTRAQVEELVPRLAASTRPLSTDGDGPDDDAGDAGDADDAGGDVDNAGDGGSTRGPADTDPPGLF